MADYTAYFGGQWMPFNEVRIDPLDRGFLVGDCVFDVARTFNGKSFRMREHVDRLYRSLAYVRIEVKNFSRMNFNLAELEASDVDPEGWPILTDSRGNLTEGVGYNLFIVAKDAIRTPGDRGVLQGVSRAMVFDLGRELGIPVIEEDLQPYDLYTADEAFFTSTSPCVLPVTRVDRRPIGAGKPGPVVARLLAAWSETVGVDIVAEAKEYASREQLESPRGS